MRHLVALLLLGLALPAPAREVAVEGKPFADALLRNWLGDKPADGDLKRGMLGKSGRT
jgi:hypothetical protein